MPSRCESSAVRTSVAAAEAGSSLMMPIRTCGELKDAAWAIAEMGPKAANAKVSSMAKLQAFDLGLGVSRKRQKGEWIIRWGSRIKYSNALRSPFGLCTYRRLCSSIATMRISLTSLTIPGEESFELFDPAPSTYSAPIAPRSSSHLSCRPPPLAP